MKSLKQYFLNIQEAKQFEMPQVKLSKLTVSDLNRYITICGSKFLTKETLDILDYMKDHFTVNKEITNLSFINDGWNNGELDSKIKDKVIALNRARRTKELPMYLSDKEFNDVLEENRPLDFYVYDLVSDQGRNELVKRFEPMLKNAAFKASKSVNFDSDELYSAGLEGFTYALNNYGKLRSEYVRREGTKVDIDKISKQEQDTGSKPAQITFASYATAQVSNAIMEYIQTEMNMIRRPKSDQRREKAEQGQNTKERKLSGDAQIGNDKDGNSRQMWDKLGDDMDVEHGGKSMDNNDAEHMWQEIYKRLEAKFGKDIVELWYKKNGLNGRKIEKVSSSPNDYYKLRCIEKYLVTDKVCKKLLDEIHDIMLDD